MKCVDLGKLKDRITIESFPEARDEIGGSPTVWATHATRWAYIKPISAREIAYAGGVAQRITHKIQIRFLSTLTTEMRIVFKGRHFNIHGIIDPEESHVWHVLDCEEKAPS